MQLIRVGFFAENRGAMVIGKSLLDRLRVILKIQNKDVVLPWDDCKEIAAKATVEDAHPHRFRATYATRCLQSGIDLKTVQKLLGHQDIESTMRYLARAESKKVREKVNAVRAG